MSQVMRRDMTKSDVFMLENSHSHLMSKTLDLNKIAVGKFDPDFTGQIQNTDTDVFKHDPERIQTEVDETDEEIERGSNKP